MSIKKIRRMYLAISIVGAVVMLALIAQAFISNPGEELLPTFALAELWVSALAFLAVWIALFFTMVAFLKSMAKPFIKVAFNKKGEQQTTMIFKDGKLETGYPHPWLINEGNAVARYFQIDFIIPRNFGKLSGWAPMREDNGNYILTYINEGQYTLFVNRPYWDPNMIFSEAIDERKCIEIHRASFKIKYKVYGDWAETQEGELTVKCSKRRK